MDIHELKDQLLKQALKNEFRKKLQAVSTAAIELGDKREIFSDYEISRKAPTVSEELCDIETLVEELRQVFEEIVYQSKGDKL